MRTPVCCPRCQTPMEPGFLIDSFSQGRPGARAQERWTPGDPQSTSLWQWNEVSTDQARAAIPVVSLRCPSCGCIESYAPSPKSS